MINENIIDWREDAKWTVYVHIVPKAISGHDWDKYYVGITSKVKAKYRWVHGNGYKDNKHFYRAIQKYGWDNIEHEIVAEHLTKNEAYEMEKALIQKLNCTNQEYGYNHTLGGQGSMYGYEDLTGQVVEHLRIDKLSEQTGTQGQRKWDCTCLLCGTKVTRFERTLKEGTSRSCGCDIVNPFTTHGKSKEKIYGKYQELKRKCYDKSRRTYKNFGGKGYTICDEWLNDFMSFYNWSYENGYSDDLLLYILPGETVFSPQTCSWQTKVFCNHSAHKDQLRMITYNGETHCLMEWSNILGINYGTLKSRLKKKPPEEAFIK